MNKKAVITIIGAGPAGSYAALNLTSKGFHPLVIEEHPHPGYPEHCTGHIPLDQFSRLYPRPPHKLIQNTFKGIIFHTPDNSKFKIQFKRLTTCLIDRAAFDRWLADEASSKGAEYSFSSRVKQISVGKSVHLKVQDLTSKRHLHLTSDVILNAEGWPPTLLESIRPKKNISKSNVVKAVQGWYTRLKNLDSDYVEVYLSNQYAPGFYAWIAPITDESAKIGLATRSGNPLHLFKKFITKHPIAAQKMKFSQKKQLIGHHIPLGVPKKNTYNKIIPIGDAALNVKPITGGGIILALTFASLSAKVIEEVYTKDSLTSINEVFSQKMLQYLPPLRTMKRIRDFMNSLTDTQLTKFFQASRVLLPELVEVAYPERGINLGRIMKPDNMFKLPNIINILVYSMGISPVSTVKLIKSILSRRGRPSMPFKLDS